jgi:uncharacterized repeat protein (TIGR03833 family)
MRERAAASAPERERAAPAPRLRPPSLRLEAKGRSGKVVTRVMGLPRPNLDAIAARLRKALGCGASVEGDDVLLQGSLVERASQWLATAGDIRDIQPAPAPRAQPPLATHADPASASAPAPAPAPQWPPQGTSRLDNPRNAAAGAFAGAGSGTRRSDVRPGQRVAIVLKADQASGKLTTGIVRDILTSSPTHPHGIKVRLESGEVGRVKTIVG